MNVIKNAKQLSRLLNAFNVVPVYNAKGKINGDWFQSLLFNLRYGAGFQINTNNARNWLNAKKDLFQ
jgi:hypothetical protein